MKKVKKNIILLMSMYDLKKTAFLKVCEEIKSNNLIEEKNNEKEEDKKEEDKKEEESKKDKEKKKNKKKDSKKENKKEEESYIEASYFSKIALEELKKMKNHTHKMLFTYHKDIKNMANKYKKASSQNENKKEIEDKIKKIAKEIKGLNKTDLIKEFKENCTEMPNLILAKKDSINAEGEEYNLLLLISTLGENFEKNFDCKKNQQKISGCSSKNHCNLIAFDINPQELLYETGGDLKTSEVSISKDETQMSDQKKQMNMITITPIENNLSSQNQQQMIGMLSSNNQPNMLQQEINQNNYTPQQMTTQQLQQYQPQPMIKQQNFDYSLHEQNSKDQIQKQQQKNIEDDYDF